MNFDPEPFHEVDIEVEEVSGSKKTEANERMNLCMLNY